MGGIHKVCLETWGYTQIELELDKAEIDTSKSPQKWFVPTPHHFIDKSLHQLELFKHYKADISDINWSCTDIVHQLYTGDPTCSTNCPTRLPESCDHHPHSDVLVSIPQQEHCVKAMTGLHPSVVEVWLKFIHCLGMADLESSLVILGLLKSHISITHGDSAPKTRHLQSWLGSPLSFAMLIEPPPCYELRQSPTYPLPIQ